MSVQFRGTFTPKIQQSRESYSPSQGYESEAEYKSFSQPQIASQALVAQALGYTTETVSSFGKYSLTIRTTSLSGSGTEVIIDTWEVPVSKKSLAITYHPAVLGILKRCGDLSAVLRGIKEAVQTTDAYSEITDLDPVITADEPTLFAFLDLARQGVDHFYFSAYTLKHTTNVGNRYAVNVADLNVDMIYSTCQLLTEAQNSGLWIYPMPGRLAYKIQLLDAHFQLLYRPADLPAGWKWGWLKYGSSEQTAANNRINIVTEYEFGLISTLLYPVI